MSSKYVYLFYEIGYTNLFIYFSKDSSHEGAETISKILMYRLLQMYIQHKNPVCMVTRSRHSLDNFSDLKYRPRHHLIIIDCHYSCVCVCVCVCAHIVG